MFCSTLEKKIIWHGTTEILANFPVAERTYRLRFRAPELVSALQPGQFVMLRLANTNDPLLGRPLAVYRADAAEETIDIVYLVVGKTTERLSALLPSGTPLQVWGPLGAGFQLPPADHLIMIAGGIGQTPFYTLAEESLGLRVFSHKNAAVKKISLLFGAKNKNRLACLDDFRQLGVDVRIATEDGSEGECGVATDLIASTIREANLPKSVLACCGPRPMLRAAFDVAQSLGNLPCYVSLESPMACGLGICFSCVVKYRDENGAIDDVRTCTEGPVFDAYRLVW
ncbi:MAG: dihydroorotate dehydrogenase electron transfer subunit [Planctomycetaceae bacterium]|jgi:dihydroorotate dehydrogenase electron transfer subunit|nr:dihydroorotate dehydrogenase electron transfer subunit [Planctomycetaceae bacterium]